MVYESQYYGFVDFNGPYLMHHGIKGQKWGVRRYQNPDGSLTEAGKKRYGTISDYSPKGIEKHLNRQFNLHADAGYEMRRTYGKIDLYNNKIEELKKSNADGRYDKKIAKLSSRVEKGEKKVNAIDKTQQELASYEWKAIAEGVKRNYTVAAISDLKTVKSGKQRVAALLAGGISGAAVGALTKNPYVGAGLGTTVAFNVATQTSKVGGRRAIVRSSPDGKGRALTADAVVTPYTYLAYYKDTIKRKKN